jgi:hypothetical protein
VRQFVISAPVVDAALTTNRRTVEQSKRDEVRERCERGIRFPSRHLFENAGTECA